MMFNRPTSLLMAAALMTASVADMALAQPNYGQGNYGQGNYGPSNYGQGNYNQSGYGRGSYEDGYRDGYRRGWDANRTRARFDDQAQPPPPALYEDASARWQRQYSRPYSYNDDGYYRECRNTVDPGGVIAGALIGGLLGNALGGRHSGGATIAGVVLGGAAGAVLTKGLDCKDRSYAYNSYYNGFNAGRVDVPYQWRNPDNGHYGEFRVNNYYNDQVGFRCANFTQQIWIGRTPQAATGRACQQPDGTWAVVG